MNQRIHNRHNLINWLAENAPTHTTRRLICTTSVELLGFFSLLPGSSYPGWIVIVTSPLTGKGWKIAVSSRPSKPYHTSWLIEEVPWIGWAGGNTILCAGDNCVRNQQKHELVIHKKKSGLHQEKNGV